MRLLGRADVVPAVDGLLAAAHTAKSSVLVIRGEPGIGKTELLRYAVSAAEGMRVVQVTGIESERELGHAALHRLLGDLLDRRETLPAPQRDALGAAFGLVSGMRADRFLVGLAVLTLFAEVATTQPLLCICDDAQWVDRETLQVLAFVARRLDADRVAILLGMRDGTVEGGSLAGEVGAPDATAVLDDLPTLRLCGLPAADARELLLRSANGRFDEDQITRVIAETGGNPLAIQELATDWANHRPDGGVPLADRLPLGAQLEAHFADQVRQLPHPVQTLLLVVAAEPTGDADLVWRALVRLDETGGAPSLVEAAEPVRDHELLALEPALSFRHPLMRSAVYRGATEAARRRAHAALAAAIASGTDTDRRAWHLAAANPGLDPEVADELDNAAGRARDRAGHTAEVAFLAASADRTTDLPLRASRLLRAGTAAVVAGLPARAYELLDRVPPRSEAVVLASATLAKGAACVQLDRFDEAVPLMFRGARELQALLPPEIARHATLDALQTMAMVPWLDMSAVAELLADGQPDAEPRDLVGRFLEAHRAHLLTAGGQVAVLQSATALVRADLPEQLGSRWAPLLLATLRDIFDDEAMADLTVRAVLLARGSASPTSLHVALIGRALTETLMGRLDLAELYYVESRQVSAGLGGTAFARRPSNALLRAWRGDVDGVAQAERNLPPPPVPTAIGAAAVQHARTAQAVVALASGRYGDAVDAARRVYDDDPPYWGHLVLPDLVEAGARGGDRAMAEAALRRLTDRAQICATPWALGLLARSRALLADGSAAEASYREAVDLLGNTRIVPEHARAHLLYGEWLRRRRRRADARTQLARAHEIFTAMGAAGFAERARGELVAAGASVSRAARSPDETLTAHEVRIARLAADGATNQQIATELVISPNTVEYHLRKIFRKMGVSSRRQLDRGAIDA